MLHRDILVLHGLGGGLGGLQGLIHVLGHIDLVGLPAGAGHLGQFVHLRLDGGLEAGEGQAHIGEQLGDQPLAVLDQRHEQMGLLDLLVPVLQGDVLGALNGGQRFLGKLIHIHKRNTS